MPVTLLSGVGVRVAEKLARIGLHTIQDMLFHLPLRYEDRTKVYAISELLPGSQAVVEAQVESIRVVFGRKRMLLIKISDVSGEMTLRFFNFSNAQKKLLSTATRIRCFGEIRASGAGVEMIHPEYQCLSVDQTIETDEYLTALYPVTEGVHQISMRKLVQQSLNIIVASPEKMKELLPPKSLNALGFPGLLEALKIIHQPLADDAESSNALLCMRNGRDRLVFEELLAQHLSMRRIRQRVRSVAAQPVAEAQRLSEDFLRSLPFELTQAQSRVVAEITADLAQAKAMMRLVQGDVGSGKTLVAALAALSALNANFQVALMVPTEILAEQHFQNFKCWFEPLGISVGSLSGRMNAANRRESLANLANGKTQLAIGTHALFQDEVKFLNLVLVIVDEQHRFGVQQRMALLNKGQTKELVQQENKKNSENSGTQAMRIHQLIMTATPIPRTLAMTAYADLDVSVIDELPPGRKPIKTVAIPQTRRSEVIQRVKARCLEGSQVYWVCTLIEESDVLQAQAAEEAAVVLKEALPDLCVELVHGRMKASEKEQLMQSFKQAEIDVLVATTVIEVGVDVPNASLMIIENAERLGLSQLHQLRGRVGRGSAESSCVLLYQGPLGKIAKQRLQIMRDSHDGFVIAQKDLELRGPGEVLGTRQTGLIDFKIADPVKDVAMFDQVEIFARDLIVNDSDVVEPLIRRWMGDVASYVDV